MKIFTDLAELERLTVGRRRWERTAEAIRTAPAHREQVMHSIGDSITYLRTRRRRDHEDFVGHRRYLEVVAAGDSAVELEIAAKDALRHRDDYSNLTDREHLTGTGRALRLEPGQILVCEIHEALRWPAPAEQPCTVVHVSVEGATFPNK